MNEQDTTVEVSEKMTEPEVTCYRLAHSKAVTEQEAEQAAIMLFRSLRQRDSRYVVRQLGSESLKVSMLKQSDKRHSGSYEPPR
jgi:hypothetical protein